MFLLSANNVRKNAEQLHDFEYARVVATLDIDGANGGALEDAIIEGEVTVPGSMIVTDGGTPTSPDAKGTYVLQDALLNGFRHYVREDGLFEIMHYSTSWYVRKIDPESSLFWSLGSSDPSPVGSYLGAGSATGEAIVAAGATDRLMWGGLRAITAIERARADGSYIPLDFTSAGAAIERERSELEVSSDFASSVRYPSDAEYLNRGSTSTLIQRNGKVYVYPFSSFTPTPLTVRVSGYAWLADYTTADLSETYPVDFFLSHGSRYMQWAIICEMNYIFQRFVPRQEGVLAPPEKARDEAWRDLVQWDTYIVDPNSTHSR